MDAQGFRFRGDELLLGGSLTWEQVWTELNNNIPDLMTDDKVWIQKVLARDGYFPLPLLTFGTF